MANRTLNDLPARAEERAARRGIAAAQLVACQLDGVANPDVPEHAEWCHAMAEELRDLDPLDARMRAAGDHTLLPGRLAAGVWPANELEAAAFRAAGQAWQNRDDGTPTLPDFQDELLRQLGAAFVVS